MNRNIFIGLMLALLISTVGWAFYTIGIAGKQQHETNAAITDLNQRFDELAMVSDSYDMFKTRFDEQVALFEKLRATIPGNQNYAEALEKIRAAAQTEKLHIVSLSPMLSDAYPPLHQGFKRVTTHVECYPVEMKFYGSYLEVGAFLEALVNMDVTVNIARLSLETEMQSGGTLTCDLLLYTYIYVDKDQGA